MRKRLETSSVIMLGFFAVILIIVSTHMIGFFIFGNIAIGGKSFYQMAVDVKEVSQKTIKTSERVSKVEESLRKIQFKDSEK